MVAIPPKARLTLRLQINAALRDGAPRRETGVRPFVDVARRDGEMIAEGLGFRDDYPRLPQPRVSSYVLIGPLLRSESDAERWFAFVADMLAEGRDWIDACTAFRRFAARHSIRVSD